MLTTSAPWLTAFPSTAPAQRVQQRLRAEPRSLRLPALCMIAAPSIRRQTSPGPGLPRAALAAAEPPLARGSAAA